MKKTIFSILSLFFIIATGIYAQPAFNAFLTNPSQPSPNQYEFDICIKNTGKTDFELTGFQAGLVIDNKVWNGGSASASIIKKSSDMAPSVAPVNINIKSNVNEGTQRNIKIAAKYAQPGKGQVMAPDSVMRLVRVRIQTSASKLVGLPANLTWEFQYFRTVLCYSSDGKNIKFPHTSEQVFSSDLEK